jgi:phosphatidylserine/phosphatidylglycerophosphate/cardiolipin synthase-like enzyme
MLRTRFAHATLAALLVCTLGQGKVAADRQAGPATRPGAPVQQPPAATEAGIAVFFSPDGGALAAVADLISRSRKSIDVQAYLLTTKELTDPLAEAHRRGVKVRVIVDADNAAPDRGLAVSLAGRGVPVFTDGEHKEAHDKVIIIDGQAVVTGSFNFTRAAEIENSENLLILTGKPKIIAAYQKHFERHLAHAKPLRAK